MFEAEKINSNKTSEGRRGALPLNLPLSSTSLWNCSFFNFLQIGIVIFSSTLILSALSWV